MKFIDNAIFIGLLNFILMVNSSSQEVDTTQFQNQKGRIKSNSLEVRVDLREGLELGYKHLWFPIISSDIKIVFRPDIGYDGVGIGLTLYPPPLFFVEAFFITDLKQKEHVTDAPEFNPDYCLKLHGGLMLPIGRLTTGVFISLGGGMISYVDNNYCYTRGSSLVRYYDSPKYRIEKRTIGTFSLGLGVKF
jgi:hypothetical protein